MRGSNSRKLGCIAPTGKMISSTSSTRDIEDKIGTYSVPLKLKTGAIGHALKDEVLQNLTASGAYDV